MNKKFDLGNFVTKYVLLNFVIPCFFLILFYFYFYMVSSTIYGNFNLSRIQILLYLPVIYKWPFFFCAMISLFFGVLKERKKLFAITFSVFLLISFVVYTVQYFSLYLTNRYLMPEAFLHVDQISFIADYVVGAKIIMIFLTVLLLGYICWLIINRFDQHSKMYGKYKSFIIRTVLTILFFTILCIPGIINLSLINSTKYFGLPATPPGIAFAGAVKQFYFSSYGQDQFKLPNDLKNYVSQNFGISYKENAEYPLVKDWIYKTPVPFELINSKSQKPNVIIFFIESLSASLVGSYNNQMNTPNIDSFARESIIIDGYYNHTFPTISGIRGQLCSFYPVLGENEHAEPEGIAIKLFCLPHVLNRKKYSTYFFFYSPSLYIPSANTLNMKKLIEACGFSNVFVAEDIQKRLTGLNDLQGYHFKDTVNDFGMMVDLVNYLKNYNNKNKPFLIALSTMGTHPKIDDSDDKIGQSLYKMDDAFGYFWKYFKTSPFYENTIVVLTADHAMPPTVQYKKYIGSKRQGLSFFDEITLIIFDKRYKFPKRLRVKASSVDLIPTILQMLEINDVANPFQGLSVFSDRKEHPFLLCTLMDNYYIYDSNGIHNHFYSHEKALYENYIRMTENIFMDKNKQETGMKLWFAYNKFINSNNKIWNVIFEKSLHKAEVKDK